MIFELPRKKEPLPTRRVWKMIQGYPVFIVQGAHWIEYKRKGVFRKTPFRCSNCRCLGDHISAYCESCHTKMDPEIEFFSRKKTGVKKTG